MNLNPDRFYLVRNNIANAPNVNDFPDRFSENFEFSSLLFQVWMIGITNKEEKWSEWKRINLFDIMSSESSLKHLYFTPKYNIFFVFTASVIE